ncbi:MAG: OmpA family protein [Saprospiraceae bacterium]|nr:OmpA family protein [Saprospiraceae bacterium]
MKKYILNIILIFFFTCWNQIVNADSGCTAGDKAYELLQYSKAIIEYQKCLKNSKDARIMERLADSYVILDQTVQAEVIYGDLLKTSKKYSSIMIKYANCLYVNNKEDAYRRFVDSIQQKFPNQKEIKKLLATANWKNKKENIEIQAVNFNSPQADFCPIIADGKIIFSSCRLTDKKNDPFTGESFSRLYVVDTISNVPIIFAPEISMKFNIGSCIMYDHGKKMIFTANTPSNPIKNTQLLKIYTTELSNGTWTKPVEFVHNKANSNNAHPAINSTMSIMVFASDGLSGNMDLYYCVKDKFNNWKQAVRLKNNVNSSGNEVFPSFINDSTLVFSSDGLSATGKGLDFYQSQFRKGKWSDPVILPAPFNSVADDYGLFTSDGMKSGYFTSNRDQSDGNENIFQFFTKTSPEVQPQDTLETIIATNIKIQGKITSGSHFIPNTKIVFTDSYGDTLSTAISDHNGLFDIELPPVQGLRYTAEKPGYYLENGSLEMQNIPDQNTVEIRLRELKKDAIFVLENIYYAFDKSEILPESTDELNNLYQVLIANPEINIELAAHTDSRGNDQYNLNLSNKRAKAVADFLVNAGIDSQRITSKGMGETKLVNHCKNGVSCTDEEHQVNRRTEVKILKI